MVDPDKAAVDVGAHAGKYAHHLSALTPKVYAFEPNGILAAKIARALPRNVEVHAAAISNERGVARLSFPVESGRPDTGLASIEPGVLDSSAETVSIEVPTMRLDDFACGPVGFVKIDVEGHELSVLEGAAELIARERPILLVEAEERHKPGAVASIRSFLETRGFDGFFIFRGDIRRIGELTSEMQAVSALDLSKTRVEMLYVNNFIFVPREKASTFVKRMQEALAKRSSDAVRAHAAGEALVG